MGAQQQHDDVLTFVCWKWRGQKGRDTEFTAAQVDVWAAMIDRHYQAPRRLVCITDEPDGIDRSVETIPCPVTFDWVPPPQGVRFPSSYRRLWNFSAEAREVLGPRILATDIDIIFLDDLRPLVDRDEDFVSWWDPRMKWNKIPGGIYLLRTGTLTHVWDEFDPDTSPQRAARAGKKGSDQGWMSLLLFPQPAWTVHDGVHSLAWLRPKLRPPPGARVVSTPGFDKPWTPKVQRAHPWIRDHWRL